MTYRARQDRAGIVRSRKLQWAGLGTLGRARTVLLQRSAAGVQSADLRQVAEPRGSRA